MTQGVRGKPMLGVAVAAMLAVAGCAAPQSPSADGATESHYKVVLNPPRGYSRVYILPELSPTLFGGTEHDVDVYLGPDRDKTVLAGHVARGSFLAFDVKDGQDLYVEARPFAANAFHFTGTTPLFLRPAAPRTDARGWTPDMAGIAAKSRNPDGLSYDLVEPFSGSSKIQSLRLISLADGARAYVRQAAYGDGEGAPVSAATAPAPQAGSAGPAATPAPAEVEKTLESLKRYYDKGLITRDEFDAKRREVLRGIR